MSALNIGKPALPGKYELIAFFLVVFLFGCQRPQGFHVQSERGTSLAESAMSKITKDILRREEIIGAERANLRPNLSSGLSPTELEIREFTKSLTFEDFTALVEARPDLAVRLTAAWPDMYAAHWTDYTVGALQIRQYRKLTAVLDLFTAEMPYESANWIITGIINEIRFDPNEDWSSQSSEAEQFMAAILKYISVSGRIRVENLEQINPKLMMTENQRYILRRSRYHDIAQLGSRR